MERLIAALLGLIITLPAAMAQDIKTPLVPLSVMAVAASMSPAIPPPSRPVRIHAEPGVNQVMVVALGHLNRIVTPFETPQVRTASTADVKVVKNILYVAPNDETPVTLFITPKGQEELALSLTLAPRKIPPVEITLTVSKHVGRRLSNSKAEKWETAQPYIETLTQLFRALAHEELPGGFEIDRSRGNPLATLCKQAGVTYKTGQVIKGRNLTILVGLAKSTLQTPIEFNERACSSSGVRGVAGWPSVALFPGKAIEIYVAVEQQQLVFQGRKRPSLLGR